MEPGPFSKENIFTPQPDPISGVCCLPSIQPPTQLVASEPICSTLATQPSVASVNSFNVVPPGTVLQMQSTVPLVANTAIIGQPAPMLTIVNGATALPRIPQQFLLAPAPPPLAPATPIPLAESPMYRLTVDQPLASMPAAPDVVFTHLPNSNIVTAIRNPLQQPPIPSAVDTVGATSATIGAPGSLANIRGIAAASPFAIARAKSVVATTSGHRLQSSGSTPSTGSSTALASPSTVMASSGEETRPPTVTAIVPSSAKSSSTRPVQASTSSMDHSPLFPPSLMKAKLAPFLGSLPITDDASVCLSHGLEIFMKSVLARLSLIASHRSERLADDPALVQIDNRREQLKFLRALDEHDQNKQSELEKNLILKAAKTRTRSEDPDQIRVREMARQIASEDYEREKQHRANLTALDAIGPQKKAKVCDLDENTVPSSSACDLLASQDTLASGIGENPRLSVLTTRQLDMVDDSQVGPVPVPCENTEPMLGVSSSNSTQATPTKVAVASGSSFNLASSLRTHRATLSDFQYALMQDFRLRRSRTYCWTYRR